MSEPKCPSCEVDGIAHIVTLPSDQKYTDGSSMCHVSFCAKCGHVYGVATKTVYPSGESQQYMAARIAEWNKYIADSVKETTTAVNRFKDMMMKIAEIHFSDK